MKYQYQSEDHFNKLQELFLFYFLLITASTDRTISNRVRPYFSIKSDGFPDSPKESLTATISRGVGCFLANNWAILSHKPPFIWCSSEVKIHLDFLTDFKIAEASNGLIV